MKLPCFAKAGMKTGLPAGRVSCIIHAKFFTEKEQKMGDVIGAGELHKGVKLLIDGEPWEITEFDFSKPGKGQAISTASCAT